MKYLDYIQQHLCFFKSKYKDHIPWTGRVLSNWAKEREATLLSRQGALSATLQNNLSLCADPQTASAHPDSNLLLNDNDLSRSTLEITPTTENEGCHGDETCITT